MTGNEKKNSRPRRQAGKETKPQDQALTNTAETPKIGKIAGPKAVEKQPASQRRSRKQAPRKPKRQTLGSAPIAAAQQAAVQAGRAETPPPAPRRGRGRPRKTQKPSIRAYFLGGLNEIGKNFTLYECQDDMIIVDCGLAFPDEDMPGVDLVIPDFSFVEKNRSKIKGAVITHAHEDHIGAVPYLLKKLNIPVYGTALTIGLIESKLKEHGLTGSARLQVTPPGSRVRLGCMEVELIHVNHSIADSVALAIHSPAGILVHTGDFKVDFSPAEGEIIDLTRFAELGKQGVLALLADSTNAERPGYTKTEQSVNDSLDSLFMRAEGKRIIVATFASSISRRSEEHTSELQSPS